MNSVQQLLTDHVGLWTGADTAKKSGRGRASGSAGTVYGIKKLRELILELAVRGKLVPQDLSDEPASALLERIQEEKARLILAGKIKKGKPTPSIKVENNPDRLPNGWVCTRLADIANILNGRAYKKEELLNKGTPVLRVGNLFTSSHWYYSNLALDDDKYCNKGDLLFAWSASFGPFIWDGEKSIYHYHIWKLDLYGGNFLFKQYLYTFLLEQTQKIKSAGHGVMMIHMTKEKMEKLVVYLPPVLEQHRIVAKVDELMALCDQLEAGHTDAAEAHEKLVTHLLATLTGSQDSADFSASWQRIAAHFDMLFTTEASIDALKQALLQLAVMGKLVPQDSQDEPASKFLKHLQAEKSTLIAEGKIKKDKSQDAIRSSEIRYTIPATWEWVRMATLCRPISSGSTPSAELFQYEDGVPFLKVYNIRDQKIDFDYKKQFVSESLNGTKLSRSVLYPGDVVMNIVGPPLGKVAIIPDVYTQWNCNQAIVFFGLISPMSAKYILIYLKEGSFLKDIELIGTAGQDNISITKTKNILVPIPPLAEQNRIIAKVDELMALCDQMKERIADAATLQRELADVMVAQAVA